MSALSRTAEPFYPAAASSSSRISGPIFSTATAANAAAAVAPPSCDCQSCIPTIPLGVPRPLTTLELATHVIGDRVIFDYTQGSAIVEVSLQERYPQKIPVFSFIYKGLQVMEATETPMGHYNYQRATLIDCRYLTLESKEGYVEISKNEHASSMQNPIKYYIDTQKPVRLLQGQKVYRFMRSQPILRPQPIPEPQQKKTLEEACQSKISNFIKQSPKFAVVWAGFNQDGTLLCGEDKGSSGQLTFLWANTKTEELHTVACIAEKSLNPDINTYKFLTKIENLRIRITKCDDNDALVTVNEIPLQVLKV